MKLKQRLRYCIPGLVLVLAFTSIVSVTQPQVVYAGDPAGSGTQEVEPEFDACPGGSEIEWFLCPVIRGLVEAVGIVDGFINSQMTIGSPGDSSNPNQIFCDGTTRSEKMDECQAYHKAWATVRNIALGLMVLAGLIVLISQALGMEILDAYTIRKVLPRLIIAALAITLSWQLMQFFVRFSNDLAFGIRYIIYEPFIGIGNSNPSITENGWASGGLGFITTVFAGAGLQALGMIGILSFAATALLAVVIAFAVLILRELLIIMLIIFAPIAIAAYILPNTQRFYKLWWESFSKALLMFALIAALIATGRVFAVIAGINTENIIGNLVGFIAYFLPYFIIPATFKFAGSAMAQIGGFATDRSSGMFGGLRKQRQEARGKRIAAARAGGIYRNDFGQFKLRRGGKTHSVGKMANTFGNWTLDLDEQARVSAGQVPFVGRPLFGRQSDIMKGQIEDQRIEHSKKAAQDLDLHYQTGRAISGQLGYFADSLEDTDRRRMDKLLGTKFDANGRATQWRGVSGKNEAEELAGILSNGSMGARLASQELFAKSGAIGNFKGSEETHRADIETVGLISAAKAGRLENDDIVARRRAQEGDRGKGAWRQQPGYGAKEMNLLQDLATQKRPSQSRGHGIQFDRNANPYSVYSRPASAEAQSSLMRISTQDIAGAKSEDIDTMHDTMLYGASMHKMKVGLDGRVTYDLDAAGNKVLKTGDDLARAEALQKRIVSLSQYAYGDSDVGRKLASIASEAGLDLRTGQPADPIARQMAGGGPTPPTPPEPEPPK